MLCVCIRSGAVTDTNDLFVLVLIRIPHAYNLTTVKVAKLNGC